MLRRACLTIIGAIFATSVTAETPGPSDLYQPASEYYGDARVWSTTAQGIAPACPSEDDVMMLKSAMRRGDTAATQMLIENRGCMLLNDVSHGEIIGASLAGMVIRIRMLYMPGFSDETPEAGPEVFLNVSDVVTATGEPLVDTYNAILGR